MSLKFSTGQGVCMAIVMRFLDDCANATEVKSANSVYALLWDRRQLRPARLRRQ